MRIILFPGFATSKSDYYRIIRDLETICKVIFVDNSSKIIPKSNEAEIVVGHSYGAGMAIQYVASKERNAKTKVLLVSPYIGELKLDLWVIIRAIFLYISTKIFIRDWRGFLSYRKISLNRKDLGTAQPNYVKLMSSINSPVYVIFTLMDYLVPYPQQIKSIAGLSSIVKVYRFKHNHNFMDIARGKFLKIIKSIE